MIHCLTWDRALNYGLIIFADVEPVVMWPVVDNSSWGSRSLSSFENELSGSHEAYPMRAFQVLSTENLIAFKLLSFSYHPDWEQVSEN